MKKLRVSIVEYLNAAPLVWGFTDGPLAGKYDLSFTVPSQCAEELRRGDADLGIIPSIEYQRIDGVVALPGMAIASKREVRSLLVVAKKPIEMAKRIALDTSSRSTIGLVKILSQEHWGIAPEFVEAAPDPSEMLKEVGRGAGDRRSGVADFAEDGSAGRENHLVANSAARAIRRKCRCRDSRRCTFTT